MVFSLSQEQYEALVALARRGMTTAQGTRDLERFLGTIEAANGVSRHKLWVQWQEADTALPPTARFPEVWPPNLRKYIELLSRPIARTDVDRVLTLHARSPTNVLVTPDPAALIGWTAVDQYFVQ